MPTKTYPRYKVGDTVTIRQWDDMAKEFGVKYTSITTPDSFVSEMRRYCGRRATVVWCDYDSKESAYDGYGLKLEEDKYSDEWEFNPCMFEPEPPEIPNSSTPPIPFSVLMQGL